MDSEFMNIDGEHKHDDSVTSIGMEFDEALDIGKVNAWLSRLLENKGIDIFRSKGVLNIAGSEARHVFQGVHMLMGISSSATDSSIRPWKADEPRTNKIVFIGRRLNRAELEASFR